MFPILVWTYVRLSLREEKEVEKEFGDVYRKYAHETPRFISKLGKLIGSAPAPSKAEKEHDEF